jgi:hypothetical protein
MEKLSKEDERRIVSALEKAVTYANSGQHPNDAIYKVACENKFTPPIVQRMVEAFNTSKTLSHIKNAKESDRSATFSVADTSVILDRMYPQNPTIKTASHKVIANKTDREAFLMVEAFNNGVEFLQKEAINFNKPDYASRDLPTDYKPQPYQRDELSRCRKILDKKAALTKAAQLAKQQYTMSFDRILNLTKEASSYFRFIGHIPFAEVESRILNLHGKLGKSAMDTIYEFGGIKEKRASEAFQGQMMFNESVEPYSSINKLIKAAKEFSKLADETVKAEATLNNFVAEHALDSMSKTSKEESIFPLNSLFEKDSSVDDVRGNLENFATAGMNLAGIVPTDYEAAKRKAISEVMDPVHEANLNAIKTKAILNDFISNDPVLSAGDIDPKTVTTAYNQLIELAPNLSRQPTVLRGMLRRMIQQEGVIEPHEAQQVTAIDKFLREQNQPLQSNPSGKSY